MFKALSILVCLSLVMSSTGEGIHYVLTSSNAYVTTLLQGEPDPYNEAPPSPVAPYQNGRDETRAGMWDTLSLQQLGEVEEAIEDLIALPSGLPTSAPENVLMQPSMEEEASEREPAEPLPLGLRASTSPQVPMGDPSGGLPMPWESGFPGGGSSGVDTVVNSNNGNLNLRVPIMSWKMRGGMEIDFSLYYNSRSNYWSRFGRGWSSSFDAHIWKFPGDPGSGYNKLFVRWGDGSIVKFDQLAPGSYTYKSPAGIHETVTESLDGNTYTLKTKAGMQYVFQKLTASPVWFMTKIRERISANEITIVRDALNPYTFESVSDSTVVGSRLSVGGGQEVNSQYVTQIKDFTLAGNRVWNIGYNATHNTISSIQYPGLSSPTRTFTYEVIEGKPFLESETDLRGKTWYWQFDASGVCQSYLTPMNFVMVDMLPSYYFQYTPDSCTLVKPGRSDYGTFTRTSERHQYNAGRLAHVYDEAGFYESFTWVVGDLNVY